MVTLNLIKFRFKFTKLREHNNIESSRFITLIISKLIADLPSPCALINELGSGNCCLVKSAVNKELVDSPQLV